MPVTVPTDDELCGIYDSLPEELRAAMDAATAKHEQSPTTVTAHGIGKMMELCGHGGVWQPLPEMPEDPARGEAHMVGSRSDIKLALAARRQVQRLYLHLARLLGGDSQRGVSDEALKRFAWCVDRLEMSGIRMALARCRTDLPYEHECTDDQRAAATAFVKALLDFKGNRKQRTSSDSNVRLALDAFVRLEPIYGHPGEFYDPRVLELYKNGAKIRGAKPSTPYATATPAAASAGGGGLVDGSPQPNAPKRRKYCQKPAVQPGGGVADDAEMAEADGEAEAEAEEGEAAADDDEAEEEAEADDDDEAEEAEEEEEEEEEEEASAAEDDSDYEGGSQAMAEDDE